MNRLDVILELLTPAFWSGADQKQLELRSQSVKGILRWWWRAVVGDKGQEPDKLLATEAKLFGSSEFKLKSPLWLKLSPLDEVNLKDYGGDSWQCGKVVRSGTYQIDALQYLAYGPVATVGKSERDKHGRAFDTKFNDPSGKYKRGLILKRPALEVGARLLLELTWRDNTIAKEGLEQLFRAIAALIAFGGIGSRSRKGWGALELVDIKGEPKSLVEITHSQIEHARKEFMEDPGATSLAPVPRWPTVEYRRLCAQVGPNNDWKQVLGELGVRYKGLKTTVPKANHWIFGSANPRRASSVLLTVKKDSAGKLMGFIWAFPSTKSATEEGADGWEQFLRKCSRGSVEESKRVRK